MYREFAVEVVKLVFIFAIVFLQVFFIDVFEVMEIVGTFLVDAFVEDEVFPVLFVDKGMSAVGTAQGIVLGEAVIISREVGITYFAF